MSSRRGSMRDPRNSEREDNIYRYYRDMKDGRERVKVSDEVFECPYCCEYEKKEYTYQQILNHACRIATKSRTASSRSKERHLGLEMYLKRCFDRAPRSRTGLNRSGNDREHVRGSSGPTQFRDYNVVARRESQNSCGRVVRYNPPSRAYNRGAEMKAEDGEELMVYPWMVVVANMPVEWQNDGQNGMYGGDGGQKLKEELTMLGYQPTKVRPVYNFRGHTGFCIVEFKKDWTGYDNAMRLANKFETNFLGKKQWEDKAGAKDELYAWMASKTDYEKGGVIAGHLKKRADLRTIREIETEVKRLDAKLVCSITDTLDMKEKQCEEIKENISKTEASFLNVMKQKEDMVKAFNEALVISQKQRRLAIESMYREHEQINLELDAKREMLKLHEQELREREYLNETERRKLDHLKEEEKKNEKAIMEQKKADESMAKLVEAHKKEKQQLYQRIIELQKQRDEKQHIELDIERLRGAVEVMRPISDGGDEEMKKKMESLKEDLKDKEEDFETLEDLYQTLVVKERKVNDELQDGRKELINGLKCRPQSKNAKVGIKLMGDLNLKPIVSAAEKKYPPDEVESKAMEFSSLLVEKLGDANWYPFKVIKVGEDNERVIDAEDEGLVLIKNEWGDEVYDSVVTALTELNEYNSSGRYPVPELWNLKEGKKATLAEGVEFIIRLWKTKKRKR